MPKKTDSGKSSFNPLGLFLHPGVKIVGGIFSLFAAIFFGKSQLTKLKKKRAGKLEGRVVLLQLYPQLEEMCRQLGEFQLWLKKQKAANIPPEEIRQYHTGLKTLYSEWVSHERMEAILSTVPYDPKIGMNFSNGLHELRTLNLLMESVLVESLLQSPEGNRQLTIMNGHVAMATAFFNSICKLVQELQQEAVIDTKKDAKK